METIEQAIAERRAQLAAAQHQVAIISAELRAYEHALLLSSPASSAAQRGAGQRIAPAPVGASRLALSGTGHWPQIITTLSRSKIRFTTDDVEAETKVRGISIIRKSIRSKLTELVKDGTLVRVTAGQYELAPANVDDFDGLEPKINGPDREHGEAVNRPGS